jgi:maltooligosyltrehalose trehalohydrolase
MNAANQVPGAHVVPEGVRYCVWAPGKHEADVIRPDGKRILALAPAANGYFEGVDPCGKAGDLYRYRLGGDAAFPDPASRFQPEGVHGPSMVIDASAYPWRHDAGWRKFSLDSLVIYEVHVGTFTPAGTFLGAIGKLADLAGLGVTAIELMPLADFPGRWNWGYDGVALYAPARAYGTPDDLRALVDAAHGAGLSVILDAVYNHLGPDGNYLGAYTPEYFNPAHKTPWGDALNFDGPHCAPVRDFFRGNACYWMDEFHFDGFRLDAVHAIMDDSPRHILSEIAAAVHGRGGFVFAEDERNEARLATPEADGGIGLDGVWADDFHHSVRVALTGEHEAYLADFTGSVDELRDTIENGWHYRGQESPNHRKPRGTPCIQLPPRSFCYCISNHDQVGNRAFGERLSAACSPAAYRAASALLCLVPYTPLLFQGQEWAASTPFLYFTDHNAELGRLVTEGRRKEFKGFAAFGDEASIKRIPDPQAEATFLASKLRWEEAAQGEHAGVRALYREALRLRREEPALRSHGRARWHVLDFGEGKLALRFHTADGAAKCLVLCNLVDRVCTDEEDGVRDLLLHPHLATGTGTHWELIFDSNAAQFGGGPDEADLERAALLVFKPAAHPSGL